MLNADGIHVTNVTPFKDSLELDLDGLKENIGLLLESGVTSIVPLGTVGEFASLTEEERKRVTECVVDAVNGKKTTIVGVSHTSFAEAVNLARHAKDCGADAVLMVPPYYYKDRDDGLVSFFELISNRVDIDMGGVQCPRPFKGEPYLCAPYQDTRQGRQHRCGEGRHEGFDAVE